MKTENALTHADLAQFIGGSDERYRHGLNRYVIYTAGVQFLAEQAEAYWLIDAIASYFTSGKMSYPDPRLETLQFWKLEVASDSTAILSCRADSDVLPYITQVIPFTDFPLEYADVWAGFDGMHWTLYLPCEH